MSSTLPLGIPWARRIACAVSLTLGVAGSLTLGGCGSPPPSAAPPAPPPHATTGTQSPVETFRANAPAADARRSFAYPTPTLQRLDNGLTLYVVERDTPLVVASLVLRSGSTDDPPGKSGLAALTARMLTEGTREKDDRELAEASEDLGSELSAAASHDMTGLDFEFLAEDLARALDLMAEAFTKPRLDPAVFGRVKTQWLDQLTSERQEPTTLAAIAGMRATLGPEWGAPTQGSLAGVRALSVNDLTRFHRTHYHPERAALVIAGGVSAATVQEEASRAFRGWASAKPARVPGPASAATPPAVAPDPGAAKSGTQPGKFGRVLLVDRADSVQSALFVGQPFPARSATGYETRELLNQVLGGMFTSRLNQNLREKHGFTYGARSYNYALARFGVWFLATSVRTDSTAQALSEIFSEVASVRQASPVTADELERAREELLGGYAAHLEQSSLVVEDIAELFTNQLRPEYFADFGGLLLAVGPERVQQEASTHLAPEALIAVVVGDKRQVLDGLKAVAVEVTDAPALLLD